MRKELMGSIDFFAIAKKHFLSLKDKFKFYCENAGVRNVQKVDLCAKKFTITIYYNNFSFEVETIFQINKSKKHYALYMVFEAIGFSNDNLTNFVGISNDKNMEEYFSQLIRYLHERFDALNKVSQIEAQMTVIESELIRRTVVDSENEKHRLFRAMAEEAWQKKQYKEVIKIYNEINSQLTSLEKKRLEYLKKKLND